MVKYALAEQGHVRFCLSLNIPCSLRILACQIAMFLIAILRKPFLGGVESGLQILVSRTRYRGKHAWGIINCVVTSYKVGRSCDHEILSRFCIHTGIDNRFNGRVTCPENAVVTPFVGGGPVVHIEAFVFAQSWLFVARPKSVRCFMPWLKLATYARSPQQISFSLYRVG